MNLLRTEFMRKILYPKNILNKKISKNYESYLFWSWTSNVFASSQMAIATHNMLTAIQSDSEKFRTINYIGKDIIGQIGSLAYMSKMSKKADLNPRKFLRYSHFIQQTSIFTTTITPFFPGYFLPIAGASSICSNISFTGYGAINAKCISKISINNIGEIYAKLTTVNTIGSSLGLLLGLAITTFSNNFYLNIASIPVLGIARVYTMNKAVRSVL